MKTKQDKKFTYFICYIDRNNKVGNILADFDYMLNTRENIKKAIRAITIKTDNNYRAIVDFKRIRYIAEKEGENGLQ